MKPITQIKVLLLLLLSNNSLADIDFPQEYARITPYNYKQENQTYYRSNYFFIGELIGEGTFKNVLRVNDFSNKTSTLIAIAKPSGSSTARIKVKRAHNRQPEILTARGINEIVSEFTGYDSLLKNGFTIPTYNNKVTLVNCLEDSNTLCAAYFIKYINDPAGQAFMKFSGCHEPRGVSKHKTEAQNAYIYLMYNIKHIVKLLDLNDNNKNIVTLTKILNILSKTKNTIAKANQNDFYDFQGFLTLSKERFVAIDPPDFTNDYRTKNSKQGVLNEVSRLINFLKKAQNQKSARSFLNNQYVTFKHFVLLIENAISNPKDEKTAYLNKISFYDFTILHDMLLKWLTTKKPNFPFNFSDVYNNDEQRDIYMEYARKQFLLKLNKQN